MKRAGMMMAAIAVFAATLGAATIVRAGETDLMLRAMVRNAAEPSRSSWRKATEQAGGAVLVPCLVRTRDAAATTSAIEEAGGDARAIGSGRILTARLPVDAVAGIARRSEVEVV